MRIEGWEIELWSGLTLSRWSECRAGLARLPVVGDGGLKPALLVCIRSGSFGLRDGNR
jgi:hypothetical protein